jgi:hypothetical protein
MKRRMSLQALAASALAVTLLLLGGCETVQDRIVQRQAAFQSMSPSDQALVQEGKIREGMSRDAVYIAWGAPNQRGEGRQGGRSVENWIYFNPTSTSFGGGFGGFGYPYGYGYGGGFGYGYLHGFRGHHHRGYVLYDPFYDPFFFSSNRIVSYPERTVSFQNGRVIAFQFLPAPRIF